MGNLVRRRRRVLQQNLYAVVERFVSRRLMRGSGRISQVFSLRRSILRWTLLDLPITFP